MKAITREEKIMSGENLTPITRKEMFLAKASGMDIETPTPITREEMFLSKITGGGGSTNLPLAYTVSSVDELPSNAVVGSLAKVKAQHSFYGEYWLSPTISMPYNLFEGVFFECGGVQYKTVIGYGALQYESVMGNTITVYENDAWIDEKYRHLKVKSGENTAFKNWLNENKEYFQGAETWEFYEAHQYANGIKWYIIDPNHVTVVQE